MRHLGSLQSNRCIGSQALRVSTPLPCQRVGADLIVKRVRENIAYEVVHGDSLVGATISLTKRFKGAGAEQRLDVIRFALEQAPELNRFSSAAVAPHETLEDGRG